MQELRLLGNFLNKRKELDRLYVEFDDAYKDIAPLVENKQVKDIKDPLVTQIIKGYGFRDKQITRCRKYVNSLIEQRGMWPKNKKWKNWESKDSKLEREEWWMKELWSVTPYGLNTDCENKNWSEIAPRHRAMGYVHIFTWAHNSGLELHLNIVVYVHFTWAHWH